jgi:hypothetical protein
VSNEPQDTESLDEAAEAITRLERALERIGIQAQPADVPVSDIAGRLDALIAQLRTVLGVQEGAAPGEE